MTVTLPWSKPAPKHRAVDRVDFLEHQVAGLENLAKRQGAQLDGADAHIEQRDNDLRHTASQLGTAVIEASESEARATEAERQMADMRAELIELRQFKANVCAVSTTIGHRDTAPDDESTHPIDVSDLRARYADDHINRTPQAWQPIPLHQSPQTVTPKPAADDDPTLTIRFPAAGHLVTATGDHRTKASA